MKPTSHDEKPADKGTSQGLVIWHPGPSGSPPPPTPSPASRSFVEDGDIKEMLVTTSSNDHRSRPIDMALSSGHTRLIQLSLQYGILPRLPAWQIAQFIKEQKAIATLAVFAEYCFLFQNDDDRFFNNLLLPLAPFVATLETPDAVAKWCEPNAIMADPPPEIVRWLSLFARFEFKTIPVAIIDSLFEHCKKPAQFDACFSLFAHRYLFQEPFAIDRLAKWLKKLSPEIQKVQLQALAKQLDATTKLQLVCRMLSNPENYMFKYVCSIINNLDLNKGDITVENILAEDLQTANTLNIFFLTLSTSKKATARVTLDFMLHMLDKDNIPAIAAHLTKILKLPPHSVGLNYETPMLKEQYPLHAALLANDTAKLNDHLIDEHADTVNIWGQTPLMCAAIAGVDTVVERLCQLRYSEQKTAAPEPTEPTDVFEHTALYYAINKQRLAPQSIFTILSHTPLRCLTIKLQNKVQEKDSKLPEAFKRFTQFLTNPNYASAPLHQLIKDIYSLLNDMNISPTAINRCLNQIDYYANIASYPALFPADFIGFPYSTEKWEKIVYVKGSTLNTVEVTEAMAAQNNALGQNFLHLIFISNRLDLYKCISNNISTEAWQQTDRFDCTPLHYMSYRKKFLPSLMALLVKPENETLRQSFLSKVNHRAAPIDVMATANYEALLQSLSPHNAAPSSDSPQALNSLNNIRHRFAARYLADLECNPRAVLNDKASLFTGLDTNLFINSALATALQRYQQENYDPSRVEFQVLAALIVKLSSKQFGSTNTNTVDIIEEWQNEIKLSEDNQDPASLFTPAEVFVRLQGSKPWSVSFATFFEPKKSRDNDRELHPVVKLIKDYSDFELQPLRTENQSPPTKFSSRSSSSSLSA